jgi:hypothetical protein
MKLRIIIDENSNISGIYLGREKVLFITNIYIEANSDNKQEIKIVFYDGKNDLVSKTKNRSLF